MAGAWALHAFALPARHAARLFVRRTPKSNGGGACTIQLLALLINSGVFSANYRRYVCLALCGRVRIHGPSSMDAHACWVAGSGFVGLGPQVVGLGLWATTE